MSRIQYYHVLFSCISIHDFLSLIIMKSGKHPYKPPFVTLKPPFVYYLVGGLEHEVYFSIQLGMSSSQLMNS